MGLDRILHISNTTCEIKIRASHFISTLSTKSNGTISKTSDPRGRFALGFLDSLPKYVNHLFLNLSNFINHWLKNPTVLSTCMGPPIRRALSAWWSNVTDARQSNAIRINYDRIPVSEDIELSGLTISDPPQPRTYVGRDRFGRAALERSGL